MKYDPLKSYLLSCQSERLTLSFKQLEEILSFPLPNSAKQYNAWWANGSHDHANAWLDAGYRVEEVNFTRQFAVFVKGETKRSAPLSNTSHSTGIPHRTTDDKMTICSYTFSFIQELIPECDADGAVKEYRPQADYNKSKPLNAYGSGAFCHFTIHAGNWPGVYLWVVDGEIVYIGETSQLARRFNTGYGTIAAVNCYIGGQTTNCKMNKVVLELAKQGKYVKLYFYETEDYKRVELELLGQINTMYNVKDN